TVAHTTVGMQAQHGGCSPGGSARQVGQAHIVSRLTVAEQAVFRQGLGWGQGCEAVRYGFISVSHPLFAMNGHECDDCHELPPGPEPRRSAGARGKQGTLRRPCRARVLCEQSSLHGGTRMASAGEVVPLGVRSCASTRKGALMAEPAPQRPPPETAG